MVAIDGELIVFDAHRWCCAVTCMLHHFRVWIYVRASEQMNQEDTEQFRLKILLRMQDHFGAANIELKQIGIVPMGDAVADTFERLGIGITTWISGVAV